MLIKILKNGLRMTRNIKNIRVTKKGKNLLVQNEQWRYW